jgi:hypothetical protein
MRKKLKRIQIKIEIVKENFKKKNLTKTKNVFKVPCCLLNSVIISAISSMLLNFNTFRSSLISSVSVSPETWSKVLPCSLKASRKRSQADFLAGSESGEDL